MHTITSPVRAMPAAWASPQRPQKVRTNLPGTVAFFALCALCMANINFITRALFGTEQVFSILYLLSAIVVLIAFGAKLSTSLGSPGRMWVAAIIIFLLVSTRMGVGIDKAYFMTPRSNLYRVLYSLLITAAAAAGARHMVLTGRLQLMLRVLFGFTVFAALTILITRQFPWLLKFASEQAQGRSAGFFGDANRAGQAVCVAAAFGFATLVGEKGKFKFVIYAALASLVPCLFFTYSRSAIVFMAVLGLLQFVISPILKHKASLLGILILAICIPLGVNKVLSQRGSVVYAREAADLEQQQNRMRSLIKILTGEATDDDLGHRFKVGSVGLQYFRKNPIVGAGFQTLTRMPEINLGCHNTFLRVFGEAGLFVGLFYIATIVHIVFVGFRSSIPEVKCLVVGFMAVMCCASMVSHSLLTDRLVNVSIGVCFGMLSAAAMLARTRLRTRPGPPRMVVGAGYPGA